MLPSEPICTIWMLHVSVWSFMCSHDSLKLLSVKDICFRPCPIIISCVYGLYPFTKLGISMLIPSNTLFSLLSVTLLNPIYHCVLTGVVSLLCCLYLGWGMHWLIRNDKATWRRTCKLLGLLDLFEVLKSTSNV